METNNGFIVIKQYNKLDILVISKKGNTNNH